LILTLKACENKHYHYIDLQASDLILQIDKIINYKLPIDVCGFVDNNGRIKYC